MEIVVDSSVVIAVVANQPERNTLLRLTQEADLIAPPAVHWQIGSAFAAMLKRGRITVGQAVQTVQLYRQIPIRWVEIDLEEALRIASELGVSAYDAYLIRCALKYKAPLLSLDRELIHAAKRAKARAIEVVP